MIGRLRRWWLGRGLRLRITVVVGGAALVALLLLSRLGVGLLTSALLDSADAELRSEAGVAAQQLSEGVAPERVARPGLRILDTAGVPADDAPALPLAAGQVAALAAGEPVMVGEFPQFVRFLAVPVTLSDGSTRLVVAAGELLGGTQLIAQSVVWFTLGALALAVVVAGAAWGATRAALRPVDRLRAAAAALPPGQRLPVPPARDELASLAEEMNLLLARRDEAVSRLQRFTGDAAHELRSPVAAIRAQAEVATLHPDPELADETLRAVAVEAERLTALVADLLALARADSGRRRDPVPVDLVVAAAAAIARAEASGPAGAAAASPAASPATPPVAFELIAPTPARVSAGPAEVDTVLDNLIGNARRHTRSVVRVAVLPAGRWVRLVVEDDGPGIPAGERQRVFDRFVRLDPDPDGTDATAGRPEGRDTGGAGLGLALVQALVDGRGGLVVAGEARGGGARLEVRWPGAVADTPTGPLPAP